MTEHWTDHGKPTQRLEDVPGLGRWRSGWAEYVARYDALVGKDEDPTRPKDAELLPAGFATPDWEFPERHDCQHPPLEHDIYGCCHPGCRCKGRWS